MDDKLKNFIRENRDDFEVYQTDTDSLWDAISSGIDESENLEKSYSEPPKARRVKRKKIRKVWQIAAAVVCFLGAGLFLMNVSEDEAVAEAKKLQKISPELYEAEQYYSGLIQQKMEIIQARHSDINPVLFQDIQAMDSAYLELRQDLQDNADNAQVIEAMIQHYRIKLQILESMLQELESEEIKETSSEFI